MMDENAKRKEPKDAKAVMLDAMVESALRSAAFAERCGLRHDRIVIEREALGCARSHHRLPEARVACDYPLHLGLTEAGMGVKGIVASTAALAVLLQQGIGDTIRISLTPSAGGDRTEEVRVAQQILQSMELRSFFPQVTSCPGCGRTTSTFFQELAEKVQKHLQERMPVWRSQYPGSKSSKWP